MTETSSSEPPAGVEQPWEPKDSLPQITIDDLPDTLRRAANGIGWTSLLPVQAMAIPYLRAGRDLMVQSRTGTGKSGAFLIPIIEKVDPDRASCQALILVPTRELARQVAGAAGDLASGAGVRSAAVYGGVGYQSQLDALKKGAHLVVGTPGRLLDHLMRRSLVLDDLRYLVFDEADRMLSVGFYPDIKALEEYLPKQRHGFMFSATFPPYVISLADQFLDNPEMLNLSRGGEHVIETEHVAFEVPPMEKDRCLVRIIEMENPASALIFCNTKAQVRYVSTVLRRFGYDAEGLSGDLAQGARNEILSRVHRQKLRFLVATDVAGRGIDIPHLSHVFLYDFPEDHEAYIHRTGRTGRAGASGVAISLVSPLEQLELASVVRRYGIDIQRRPLPTEEDVQAIVSERVTTLLEAKLRNLDKLVRERMERMLPLSQRLGEHDDELGIIGMLLDEYYQNILHAPPELPPISRSGQARRRKGPLRRRAPDGASRNRRRSGGAGRRSGRRPKGR